MTAARQMDRATRREDRRRWVLVAGSVATVATVALVAWLAFGYFGVQGLVVDDEVDEAVPVFDSGATATTAAASAGDARPDEGDASTGASEASAARPTTAPTPAIEVAAAGEFSSRDHPTSGRAAVLTDGTAQRFLRLEGFATDNGPDLNVYLTTTRAAGEEGTFDDDFIDLGDLQGNVGDQNYLIPESVDLDRYATVVIWCVRFDSAFGAADLA